MYDIKSITIKIIILLVIFHSLSGVLILYIFGSQAGFLNSLGAGGEGEEEYFNISLGILKGKPIKTIRNIGFPLFFIPFIYMFKAVDLKQILFPYSFFNSLIVYNISIVLIAIIALKLSHSLRVSILSATLWTIFPWLVYFLAKVKPEYDYPGLSLSRLICQMFMYISNDGISTLFVLLTVYLCIIFLNHKKYLWSVLLGLSFAISVLIRIQNIVLLSVILFVYINRKEFKKFSVFIISAIFSFLPQFIYNWATLHSLSNLNFIIESLNTAALEDGYTSPFYSIKSIHYIFMNILQRFPLYIPVAVGLISIIVIFIFVNLYHKERLSFYILLFWILSYIMVYGLYYGSAPDLLRYMMPIIPAILILISFGAVRFIGSYPF